MIASEIMTRSPRCIEADSSAHDALEIIIEQDIRHLPVLEDGKLVGILSDRDLLSLGLSLSIDEASSEKRLDASVSDIMSSDTISVGPDSDVLEVVDIMIENKIGAVLVVDSREDKLVGIVSYVDLLRVMRDSA